MHPYRVIQFSTSAAWVRMWLVDFGTIFLSAFNFASYGESGVQPVGSNVVEWRLCKDSHGAPLKTWLEANAGVKKDKHETAKKIETTT